MYIFGAHDLTLKSWAPKINIFFKNWTFTANWDFKFPANILGRAKHEQHMSPSSSLARQAAIFLLQNKEFHISFNHV